MLSLQRSIGWCCIVKPWTFITRKRTDFSAKPGVTHTKQYGIGELCIYLRTNLTLTLFSSKHSYKPGKRKMPLTFFRNCENSKQCKRNPILSSPQAHLRVCITATVQPIRVCKERSTKHGKERIRKTSHIATALILQRVEHQWQTCHWWLLQNTVLCNVTPYSLVQITYFEEIYCIHIRSTRWR